MAKHSTSKVITISYNKQTIMSVIQLLGLVSDENGMYSLSSIMARFHKKLNDKVMFKVYVWIDNYIRSSFDDGESEHEGRTAGHGYRFVYDGDDKFDYICNVYAPGLPVDILLDGNSVCKLLSLPNDFLHLTMCKGGYSEGNKKLIEDIKAYLYVQVFNNNREDKSEHRCAEDLYHGSINEYIEVRKILRLIMDDFNWHDYIVDNGSGKNKKHALEYYIWMYDTYKEKIKHKRKFDEQSYRIAYNRMNNGVIISKTNIYG